MNKFGFLRENKEKALKAGIDTETGLCRTGLDEYLNVIFPNINDWVHDKQVPKELCNGIITLSFIFYIIKRNKFYGKKYN